MRTALASASILVAALAACIDPSDRRPGTRLGGNVVSDLPSDWTFSDAHAEIAVEVRTPYLIPHSVTVWCASLDGVLYLGARDPQSKRWPAWADRDPEVRVGIGEDVYEVRLVPLDDAATLERLRAAYTAKYALPSTPSSTAVPSTRYWRVEPRG